jgi:putative thioredoxin
MKQQTNTFQATTENFDQLVLDNSYKGPVMVHFWAPWVGPCMMLKPLLEKLLLDYGCRFLNVSMSNNPL